MPARARAPALGVAEILNKSQETAGSHAKLARMLWQLEAAGSDACFQELQTCLGHCLRVPLNTNSNVERALRFVAAFAGEAPERPDDSGATFVQDLLAELARLAAATDRTVRTRACGLLAGCVQRLRLELQADALEELQAALLARLKDKAPQVRLHAAAALERLAEPGEDGCYAACEVTAALRRLLSVERNKDVRRCLLGALPLVDDSSLQDVVQRTLDVADAVRRQAYAVLAAKVSLADLGGPERRALLLRRGLRDRAPAVAEAARGMLRAWLADGCDGSVTSLLAALDVRRHAGEAEAALEALAAGGGLEPRQVALGARDSHSGLRAAPGGPLLSDEDAFLWRWMCEGLRAGAAAKGREAAAGQGAAADVAAAEAGDLLQALEAALPDSVEGLTALIAAHARAGRGTAVCQLLRLAACCADLSDASGRKAAAELLDALMADTRWAAGGDPGWQAALLTLARQVHAPPQLHARLLAAAEARRDACLAPGADAGEWRVGLAFAGLLLREVPPGGPAGRAALASLAGDFLCGALAHVEDVRAAGVRCLGLAASHSLAGFQPGSQPCATQVLPPSLLRAAARDPACGVRQAAAEALSDLALTRGLRALDACHGDAVALPAGLESAAVDSRPALDILLGLAEPPPAARGGRGTAASQAAADCVAAATAGLAKLVMHDGARPEGSLARLEASEVTRALAALLAASVNPATEAAPAARQCLATFLPAFAAFSPAHRGLLAAAALPAARAALERQPTAVRGGAPQLLRCVLQLLQAAQGAQPDEGEQAALRALAEACLADILAARAGGRAKAYAAALARLCGGLPLQPLGGAQQLQGLRVAAGHVAARLSGTAAKDLSALERRVAAMVAADAEPLGEEAVAGILARLEGAAAAAATPAPARSARDPALRRTSRRPAVREQDTSESEEAASEPEEAESDDGASEPRGEPARAAAEGQENAPALAAAGKAAAKRRGSRPQLQDLNAVCGLT